MIDKTFVAAAFAGLMSQGYITSHLEKGVNSGMTPEEARETRKKNAEDIAEMAVWLGEVLTKKYEES